MAIPHGFDEHRTASWADSERVDWYLGRIDGLEPRVAGEEVLRTLLPDAPRSLLDLGCGDGRLAALVLAKCPSIGQVLAVDSSPPMLERTCERFAGDHRVTVRHWDLADSLAPMGTFDVIVSGFAIHHLEDERKQSLFGEIANQLHAGGLFANLEVVASATSELHNEFLRLIGREHNDPADRLTDVESQLRWMRNAGLTQVDCFWRWRGFALLAGKAG